MRFSCDECGRSYVASDEVAGRAFRMRCKECGHEIVVRPAIPVQPPPAAAKPAASDSGATPPRPAFDPFEGEEVAQPDVAVTTESLDILDRTPPAVRLPTAPAVQPRPAAAPVPAAPRAPAPPRVRPGRMLPAEDEEKLGPPGQEDRGGVPRWIIALVVAALAAAGGILLRR